MLTKYWVSHFTHACLFSYRNSAMTWLLLCNMKWGFERETISPNKTASKWQTGIGNTIAGSESDPGYIQLSGQPSLMSSLALMTQAPATTSTFPPTHIPPIPQVHSHSVLLNLESSKRPLPALDDTGAEVTTVFCLFVCLFLLVGG